MDAARYRRPIVGVAGQDKGVGFERSSRRVARRIKSDGRSKGRLVGSAHNPGQHCLQHGPSAVREADYPNPLSTNLGCRTQISSAVKGITRLRLGWHQAAVIADIPVPTRPETIDQQRREPPLLEPASPLAIMQTNTIAAMENNDSPYGRGSDRKIKLSWGVTERWPNLGGVEDLCFSGTRQNQQEQGGKQVHCLILAELFDQRRPQTPGFRRVFKSGLNHNEL